MATGEALSHLHYLEELGELRRDADRDGVPDDIEEHEVYRHVTGLVASVEEKDPDYTWEDIAALLEDRGFVPVDFILGPALD